MWKGSNAVAEKKLDTDDPDHIGWLYKVATSRAAEFKIEGVTWSLTQGVVKNIIPAIASTNAIIAGTPFSPFLFFHPVLTLLLAACCNEAFKIATSSAAYLNNYFMLIGTDGIYSYTFEHEKRSDCPVCGGEAIDITLKPDTTVEQLIDILVEKQGMQVFFVADINWVAQQFRFSQIKKPSLSTATKQIYFQAPPQLEQATRPNLEKKLSELVQHREEITVTASTLPFNLTLKVTYET